MDTDRLFEIETEGEEGEVSSPNNSTLDLQIDNPLSAFDLDREESEFFDAFSYLPEIESQEFSTQSSFSADLQASELNLSTLVFGKRRLEIEEAFRSDKLSIDKALSALESLEQEQEQSGYLSDSDRTAYSSLVNLITSQNSMATNEGLAEALVSAFRTVGIAGGNSSTSTKTKRKEQEPPSLSEINAVKWKTFRQGFELASAYNEWEDKVAVVKMRLALKDEAARAVEHLSFSDQPSQKDALDRLEKVFVNPSGQDLAEVEFKKAKRKRDETFQAFHIRLRNLFCRAYPLVEAETSKELKDAFILHLGDPDTSKQLRSSTDYRSFTYSNLLTRSQDLLAASSLIRQAYSSHSSVHQMTFGLDSEESSVSLIGAGECFHCLQKGHIARECTIADRIIKRIQNNPERFGLMRTPTNKTPMTNSGKRPPNTSQNQRQGAKKKEGVPSTPMWGRSQSRNKKGGTSRWRTSPEAKNDALFAVTEDMYVEEEETETSSIPEEVVNYLQDDPPSPLAGN